MRGPSRTWVVWLTCSGTLAAVTAAVIIEQRIIAAGYPNFSGSAAEVLPFLVAMASASVVGTILAVRRPEHPVGWLFLALGGSIALSALLQAYAYHGEVARPGSLPAAHVVAALSDGSFVTWFILLAWVLHLTPTGSPLSTR